MIHFLNDFFADFRRFWVPFWGASPVWASWPAPWRCLALSWAILRDLLRFFASLGSIFYPFRQSWLNFGTIFDKIWPPFFDLKLHFSMILGSFVVRSWFCIVFVMVCLREGVPYLDSVFSSSCIPVFCMYSSSTIFLQIYKMCYISFTNIV